MQVRSLLIGAVIAAMTFVPGLADGWVNGQWRTYNTRALKLENVAATVRVDVKDNGPMAVQISGQPDRVGQVHVDVRGNTLAIKTDIAGTVWDWRHWFDFRRGRSNPGQLQIHISVPRGAAVDVEAVAGNVTIGDTMGTLRFSVEGYTESTIGNVSEANVEMAGAGRLTIANVTGNATIETAGSGNIRIGNARFVKAEIAGSGSIAVGNVAGIDVDIAGSGDFNAADVHGRVSASIAGSGSVTIASGEADPFRVEIMGSGNVSFGGTAVNPHLEAMGSGSVRIHAYRGNLHNEGTRLSVGG
jgi:hypothetical protein